MYSADRVGLVVAALKACSPPMRVLGSTKLVRNHFGTAARNGRLAGTGCRSFSASCRCGLESVMQGLVLVLLFGSFAIELKYHDVMKASQVVEVFRRTCRAVPCSACCAFSDALPSNLFVHRAAVFLAAWARTHCALFSGMLFGKHKTGAGRQPEKDGRGRRRRGRRCRPRADRGCDYEPDATLKCHLVGGRAQCSRRGALRWRCGDLSFSVICARPALRITDIFSGTWRCAGPFRQCAVRSAVRGIFIPCDLVM